jgi:hypothetical protein
MIRRTGARDARVFVTNIRPGGGFFDKIPMLPRSNGSGAALVAITEIEGIPIKTLDDVIACIPDLMKKRDFYIKIKNFGTEFGFSNTLYFSQSEQIRFISYRRADGLPEIYTFDPTNRQWQTTVIAARE